MSRHADEDSKPWDPLSIKDVSELLSAASFPWWIAGGYAIERFVGVPFRTHGDIDVLVLRRDAAAVHCLLSGWDLWASDPPGQLRPWLQGERLPVHVSDIWCRRHRDDPWRLQLMLDNAVGLEWRSRRCGAVSMPIEALGFRDQADVPILQPQVQLFYKAKSPRSKDTQDFERCLPLMTDEQTRWLRQSIEKAYGECAPWLTCL